VKPASLLLDLKAPAPRMLSPVVLSPNSVGFMIPGSIPGPVVEALMRKHGVTIDGLAKKMRVTATRVRQVRSDGLTGWFLCSEWLHGITGTWFIPQPVALKLFRPNRRRRAA
jgi:hypothetical protein